MYDHDGITKISLSMKRPEFDDIFVTLAMNLAKRSHCVKKQVGAVLTKDTRIISIGYNGPPAGTHNCDEKWPGVGCSRDIKGSCFLALHAEQNAILYAVKNHASIEGAVLYVTLAPCLACARMIFSAGIKTVIYVDSYAAYKGIQQEEGVDFLREFGVAVNVYRQ
jgi:dCMP deaminase